MLRLKRITLVAVPLIVSGCVPLSSNGLYTKPADFTVASAKTPHDFATCVVGAFSDAGLILSEGNHFWVTRQFNSATIERWDFTPTPTGSKAERRSGQLFHGSSETPVKRCA